MNRQTFPIITALAVLFALSGCDKETPEASQTDFPGQLTAGGGTSGEVMAKIGILEAKVDPASSPVLVVAVPPAVVAAPSAPTVAGTEGPKPAGTPGIPEGAGGTTSGPAMGGTTPAAAGTQRMDGVETGTAELDKAAKEAKAKDLAEKEKRELAASMDDVAARWRANAAARGWTIDGPSGGASAMPQTQTSAMGLPAFIRSEKLGTVPPSEDVKQPAKDPSN